MGICAGLLWPKIENVEKVQVLPLLFEGSKAAKGRQENERRSGPRSIPAPSRSKKWDSWLKMLCGYIENCASYAGGEHNCRNLMKKNCRKVKHGAKIMSDTSKYHQNGVGNIKMSSKSCRIHHWSRTRRPPVAIIHIFATFFEVQLGRHGGDKSGKERTTER